ncbi:hypothetical protein ABPG75_004129, partial [Micractinium tetrahymenae]
MTDYYQRGLAQPVDAAPAGEQPPEPAQQQGSAEGSAPNANAGKARGGRRKQGLGRRKQAGGGRQRPAPVGKPNPAWVPREDAEADLGAFMRAAHELWVAAEGDEEAQREIGTCAPPPWAPDDWIPCYDWAADNCALNEVVFVLYNRQDVLKRVVGRNTQRPKPNNTQREAYVRFECEDTIIRSHHVASYAALGYAAAATASTDDTGLPLEPGW